MKKLGILLGLVLIAVPVIAFACHNAIVVDVSDCGQAKIMGTFYGDARYAKVAVYVDGVLKGEATEYRLLGNASASKTVTVTDGSLITVKGYTKANIISAWVLKATTTKEFAIESCYTSCAPGGETYTVEGVTYWDAALGQYVTPFEVFDAVTDKLCGDGSNGRPADRCVFNRDLPIDSDEMKRQGYGLGELWGPDGQYATMYIYPDKDGNLPIGIGVGRQQCVLGWEAIRSGHFGFVYQNCRGEYFWNGVNVTPRPDVLKHGVCARNGACIEQ